MWGWACCGCLPLVRNDWQRVDESEDLPPTSQGDLNQVTPHLGVGIRERTDAKSLWRVLRVLIKFKERVSGGEHGQDSEPRPAVL